jgi:predicted RNA-binding protein with PUA-like domain
MPKQYWLVKSEPESYSWSTFLADKGTVWSGVRNYQARNNLRAMKKGDLVFFYHSVSEKAVVGIARVRKEYFPDPTATEGDWSAVELEPVKAVNAPISLDVMKVDKALAELLLIRNSRISVTPVSEPQYQRILELAGK